MQPTCPTRCGPGAAPGATENDIIDPQRPSHEKKTPGARGAARANRPTTVAGYIDAAPAAGRPHLQRLREILKSVAPHAQEVIKWGTPFFIEPRFLFAYSACKAHCNFAPSPEALEAFGAELKGHRTTKSYLQIPYAEPLPEALIRRIAEHRLKLVNGRDDDAFW